VRTIYFRNSSAVSIAAANGSMKSQALALIGAIPKMKLPSGVQPISDQRNLHYPPYPR
jgi:hypothetical protein